MAKWIFADNNIEIRQELEGVPVSILRMLKRRGVEEEKFEDFLAQYPKASYDPLLLDDLKPACEKILDYARSGKRICVYGDYDADGVTSTCLLVSVISHFTDKVSYYIPSRFSDGYGPNNIAIKKIADDGTDLLVTVDCGITSKKEIEYAMSFGMDCIVTDHHILRDGMTPECLTVNPHRAGSKYPFSDLSGCGVAFKMAQGIQRICEAEGRQDLFSKKDLNALLDLVAISTVADIVPLLDENRSLVKYGLERINRREREGLNALLSELSLDGVIDASGISFIIAPNINALGRMDRADKGVELLLSTESSEKLNELAQYIKKTNQNRKTVQEETSRVCKEKLLTEDCGDYAPVIFAPDAHEGVAGIVAGGLKEELNKPICIVSMASDGSYKGTGRSVAGLNLHSLFENCGDVFERFGGHAGACGFTVKQGKLEEFRRNLNELVKREIEKNPSLAEKTIFVEKELSAEEKTIEFAEALQRLEPFGEANPVPIFCVRNAHATDIRLLGSEGQHLKFNVVNDDGIRISCICFGGSKYESLVRDNMIDVAGEFGINEFRGSKQIQLKVIDIKEN